jgi:hypothetical protein
MDGSFAAADSRGSCGFAYGAAIGIWTFGMLILGVGRLIRWSPLGWRWWIAFPLTWLGAVLVPDPQRAPPPQEPVGAPTLYGSFRDLAQAQEGVFAWRGEYTLDRAELGAVALPKETEVTLLSATTRSWEIRVESGHPVAKSCLLRGGDALPGGKRRFTIDCREPGR